MEYENLAIAIGTGTDADGWNTKLFGDASAQFARDGFQNYRKCAGGFNGFRIALKLLRRVGRFPLDVKSSQSIDRLRSEINMAHHRYLGFDKTSDQFETALAAFDLHGLGSAFFYQAH